MGWYVFCPYCDSCQPFNLIRLNTSPWIVNSKLVLEKSIETLLRANPPLVDVVLYVYLKMLRNLSKIAPSNTTAIRELFFSRNMLKYRTYSEDMPFAADVHIISQIFPQNSIINFKRTYNKHRLSWQPIKQVV